MSQDNLKIDFDVPKSALAKWQPDIKAKNDDNAINIYSEIGENYDGTGMTPKLVSAILRRADGDDVTVNINSPGGSFFDGLAIYNLLNEYDGKVTVKVIGLAASAASLVALAGDDIEIAENGFFMIHNSWTIALANKEGMREVADMLEKFDESMTSLYAAKTGKNEEDIRDMMVKETWLSGKESVEMGFASALLGEDVEQKEEKKYNSALRSVDTELAKAGMPRSKRRELIKDLTGTPCAADPATPCAGEEDDLVNALSELLTKLTKGSENDRQTRPCSAGG